jgi:mannosyltransferase OCH1-like enzyme
MKRCVESWKKFCPDFDIIEWNEDNFDVNQNRYISEAYNAKKWAFVSDFARMDVIYRYGGVYMDTDVEVLKPLDRFLNEPAFCGTQKVGSPVLSTTFGAVAGNELVRLFRDIYTA